MRMARNVSNSDRLAVLRRTEIVMPERPSATPAGWLRPELFRRTFLKLIASATAGAAIAPAFTANRLCG